MKTVAASFSVALNKEASTVAETGGRPSKEMLGGKSEGVAPSGFWPVFRGDELKSLANPLLSPGFTNHSFSFIKREETLSSNTAE
ncbi:MAG: hypothetical protein WCV91_01900 [Candidatus Margulisiibacteriota bacterium]